MARSRTLLLDCDPLLDDAFRRRLERALTELGVEHALANEIDADPDGPAPARLALVSPASQADAPADRSTLVVIAGPGDAPVSTLPRLEVSDFDGASRRWRAVVGRIGALINDPHLTEALDGGGDLDDLRLQRAQSESRADEAVRAAATLERERNDAIRAQTQTEAALVAERARVRDLQAELVRLATLAEGGAHALAAVSMDERPAVEAARMAAARARIAAAHADALAEVYPDALVWSKASATYSGETSNRIPHGFGVIAFRSGKDVVASYRGEFHEGRRTGYGAGVSDNGHAWLGQWRDEEACGFGVLDTPDGRHFEGEVAQDPDGAPREHAGWTWTAPGPSSDPKPADIILHAPMAPRLPAPQDS